MRAMEDKSVLVKLLDTLDEAQKRWFVGREAMLLGHGGIKRMCEVSGLSKPTVIKGVKELQGRATLRPSQGRIRQVGGGRKTIEERDPQIRRLLRRIMEETTAGDPMSLLKWTSKSTCQIRDPLQLWGHPVSEDTVQRRLKEMEYTLQANRKTKEGSAPPERDQQFRYINTLAQEYVARGEPVISVDAKKKERIGAFKNAGGSGGQRVDRSRSMCTIFRVWEWAQPRCMALSMSEPTKEWSTWACRMTPLNTRWRASGSGGGGWGDGSILTRGGY